MTRGVGVMTRVSLYLKLNGTHTTSDDPDRAVWYGSSCLYWTDDWYKLKNAGHIPICPVCGCPGYQNTFKNFVNSPPKERCGSEVRHMTSFLGGVEV